MGVARRCPACNGLLPCSVDLAELNELFADTANVGELFLDHDNKLQLHFQRELTSAGDDLVKAAAHANVRLCLVAPSGTGKTRAVCGVLSRVYGLWILLGDEFSDDDRVHKDARELLAALASVATMKSSEVDRPQEARRLIRALVLARAQALASLLNSKEFKDKLTPRHWLLFQHSIKGQAFFLRAYNSNLSKKNETLKAELRTASGWLAAIGYCEFTCALYRSSALLTSAASRAVPHGLQWRPGDCPGRGGLGGVRECCRSPGSRRNWQFPLGWGQPRTRLVW